MLTSIVHRKDTIPDRIILTTELGHAVVIKGSVNFSNLLQTLYGWHTYGDAGSCVIENKLYQAVFVSDEHGDMLHLIRNGEVLDSEKLTSENVQKLVQCLRDE